MGSVRLTTKDASLTLRAHEPGDAEDLQRLLADNADELMEAGDYGAEIATTVSQWRERFAVDTEGREAVRSLGMWLDEHTMVGRIVLVPVAPPAYGVGYWVTNPQQGKGFASASLAAILEHAAALGATDVFAGANHGNAASRRVLEKNVGHPSDHDRFRWKGSREQVSAHRRARCALRGEP